MKHNTKYTAQNYGVFTMTVNDTDKIQFHASHFLSLSASISRVEQRKNTNRLFYENASKHDRLIFHDTLRSSNKTKDFRCSNTCFFLQRVSDNGIFVVPYKLIYIITTLQLLMEKIKIVCLFSFLRPIQHSG